MLSIIDKKKQNNIPDFDQVWTAGKRGPTNLGIEESVTAFSGDSDPVMVSLEFALDA